MDGRQRQKGSDSRRYRSVGSPAGLLTLYVLFWMVLEYQLL